MKKDEVPLKTNKKEYYLPFYSLSENFNVNQKSQFLQILRGARIRYQILDASNIQRGLVNFYRFYGKQNQILDFYDLKKGIYLIVSGYPHRGKENTPRKTYVDIKNANFFTSYCTKLKLLQILSTVWGLCEKQAIQRKE